MSENQDQSGSETDLIYDAIYQFASWSRRALARKIVFRLQRMPATGIYGDDYRHKTLWDEYCHEVQIGPHDLLEVAWEDTIRPFANAVVGSLPHHDAVLLTIGAVNSAASGQFIGAVDSELIVDSVERELIDIAMSRDLTRFDPADAC